jgi:NAD(P)-dependent dehydrogenase (short-subunit alcohol dehydrogenase family)
METGTDLFSVRGRVALVTGATSGIGAMAAAAMAAAGARVYLVARDARGCKETAGTLPGAVALPGDVSTLAGIGEVVSGFGAVEDRLHLLVNNAGTLRDTPLDDVSEADWDDVVDLHLKAPFFLAQRLLPALRAAATPTVPASIVNIGSVGGLRVGPRATYSYAASKAGLHHLTRSLARRLAAEHITVNAIAPGLFPSRLTPPDSPEVQAAVQANVPRGRAGNGDDIAGVMLFFASRAGAFVTGAVLPVDGGMSV